jgi:hypothetical protein
MSQEETEEKEKPCRILWHTIQVQFYLLAGVHFAALTYM